MAANRPEHVSERYVQSISKRLAANLPVRRVLPSWGRIHIDRQLPFLCVYRQLSTDGDSASSRLITSQASYLLAPGEVRFRKILASLVQAVAATVSGIFGGYLVFELWVTSEDNSSAEYTEVKPGFKIITPKGQRLSSVAEVLEGALRNIEILKQPATVEVVSNRRVNPPGLPPLLSTSQLEELGAKVLGLEVKPVYRNEETRQVYPLVLQALRRQLNRALQRTFFEFSRSNTSHAPSHHHALGRRALVKAVWEADRELAAVSDAFDFLLQVTPVNTEAAWAAFQRSRFERMPEFLYRPRTVAPGLLKRRLYAIPLERVEDPVIAQLFRAKQLELDRQLTMLLDRESSRFVHGSLQLFGGVNDQTFKQAEELLDDLPSRSRDDSKGGTLDAHMVADRAIEEIAYLRQSYPEMSASVEVRDDIQGLMVSGGNLLVGHRTKIPFSRAGAMIQHEVGTHILTYHNGRAQPLTQLHAGLAGYEELQEGLAVLAEYLTGGLSRPRLRLLAARVVAVRRMIEGATFVDVFRELDRDYDFSQHVAFVATMRAFRGGGLTKDAVYLRGLHEVLEYLRRGGQLEPLFIGKISTAHIPVVQELLLRKVLRPPPMRPRYMADPRALERLKDVRSSNSIADLVRRRKE